MPFSAWDVHPSSLQPQTKTQVLLLTFFFFFFRAANAAHGSSQARDQIRAAAAGLCHSQSNTRSKLRLWPTPQLTGSLTQWARPGIEPVSSWILVRFNTAEPWWELKPAGFWTGIYNSSFLGSWAFAFRLELCHQHSWVSSLRDLRQILGLLIFCNHMNDVW